MSYHPGSRELQDRFHRMQLVETSVYVPAPGHEPPVPAWKLQPAFKEVLPRG